MVLAVGLGIGLFVNNEGGLLRFITNVQGLWCGESARLRGEITVECAVSNERLLGKQRPIWMLLMSVALTSCGGHQQ